MKNKLAPQLIQLAQDACLKVFWRKAALRTFLKQHDISDTTLASWHADETKREFLQRIFDDLVCVKDNKGHVVILAMARSLAEMKHFPDLENWEDSSEKISTAHKSAARLKSEVDKINSQIRDEREILNRRVKAQEELEKKVASLSSLENLEKELNNLLPRQGTQEGGYEFEKWFYNLASYFELRARPSYNADGRQIDGSLTLEGTTFLIETKFTNKQTGAPDIDIFMSKILKKADNTMGIFISMSGFSSVAIKEASRDRTPMLLLDYSHIYNLILPGTMSLREVIGRVKRHASQTGQAYLAVIEFSN